MPRTADPDARRKQISRAAITIFARDGFQGAAVGDIAAEARLSKGSIYRYFTDKEALFHAAFEAVLQLIHTAITGQNDAPRQGASHS